MGDSATTSTTLVDADDPSAWHREGPVRLLQGGQWKRKNGPTACELKRRVRCSGFETGAPCESCIRRGAHCVIGDDTYPPDASSTTVFIPILPPPPVPCPSPSSSPSKPFALDFHALSEALKAPTPRPGPLVWKSPDDSLTSGPAAARGLRKKRSKVNYSEEPQPEAASAQIAVDTPVPQRRARVHLEQRVTVTDEPRICHEPDEEPPTTRPRKRARRQGAPPPLQVKLRRHLPEQVFPSRGAVGLVVFHSGSSKLVALEALKDEPRVALHANVPERRPFAQQFPVSAARDEPFPPRASPTSLTAHASLDLDGTLMAASTRRDSLVSSFSLVSELSALFDGRGGRGRRWSVATSASSVEVGSQSTSGASGSGV